MESKDMQGLLVELIGAALNRTALDDAVKAQLTPDMVDALYRFSKHHDLSHLLATVLSQNHVAVGDERWVMLEQADIKAVYRHEQMKYAYEEICSILECASIPYIPLKGAVIRPYYPDETMRTSCDIDILVKEEDLATAVDALKARGYTEGEREYHDISLYSPTHVHLELHFHIQENLEGLDRVLARVWSYVIPTDGYRYALTNAFFVFHMYAHMSYHFLSGGCGLRSLMDVWVIQHRMGIPLDAVRELLREAGLEQFAEKINRLANVCFSGEPRDAWSDRLLNYLFMGGAYGSLNNRLAVTTTESHGTVGYALRRLFLPYRQMVHRYPVLRRVPVLLPFCWVARFFVMLFGGKARSSVVELKTAGQITDEKIREGKQLREWLGL